MRGRGMDSDAASDAGVVGTFETLRDEGEHFVHVQQYVKAIESFTKALEMKPDDITCLVVRAKCNLMLGNSEKALEDANTCLNNEDGKKDIRALNMKAEALYQKGDFETALVYYHRGNKLRPELQEFRLGIQKCQEAIDNSIGNPGSVKLKATGDLSYFYKEEEDQKLKKQKQQQKGYVPKLNQPKKEEKKERQRPKDDSKSKTTKELLGSLYQDKAYLERLFDSLHYSNNGTDDYIKARACDGLEYLNVRSDFWRQQKPMYARKRDRQSRNARSGQHRDPMKYVLQKLVEIDEAQSQGSYEESLEKSKKTLKQVEEMSDDSLKNKPDVMANLYSCMGNSYLELNMYQDALNCHKKDLTIAKDNGLEEAESRALDNLGRTCARMGDFREAIEIWKKKLPKSKSPLESTWLFHEIGRCHLEVGEFQDAKDFGDKSLAAAKEAEDPGWQLHACVLIAQSEVKCEELEAASETFTRALELAQDQGDQSAEAAIRKALDEVNDRIVKGSDGTEGDKEKSGEESSEKDTQKDKADDKAKSPEPAKEVKSSQPTKGEKTPEAEEEVTKGGAKGDDGKKEEEIDNNPSSQEAKAAPGSNNQEEDQPAASSPTAKTAGASDNAEETTAANEVTDENKEDSQLTTGDTPMDGVKTESQA